MKHWYFLLYGCAFFGQNDSINLLDEVKLYGNFSSKINAGYQIKILNDSIINKRRQSLGNLLQNQANLYFKQSGNGMVSSISLRGSGASSTGVYWNGIAINSTLNGQTDFNTLSANGFNQIEIRKGAGSVLFGSGAIGGAINLRDKVYFVPKKNLNINLGLASFNTQNAVIKTRLSTDKIYTKIVIDGAKSNNDYPYLGTDIVNENAKYKNYHLKGVFAYKINTNNQIHFFTTYSNNDRELSRTLVAPSNSKYKNNENRFLLSWKNFGSKHNSTLKLAYLNEEYNFFFNKQSSEFSFGKSHEYITKYDFNYFLVHNLSFHIGIENRFTNGVGTNIQDKERNVLESYFLIHHELTHKFNYNVSVRKGVSNIYKIPFIYAFDTKYVINSNFSIKANFATNYRLPTFNDLFWFASGNEDLQPEDSKTVELGLDYKLKNITFNITSYLTKSKNLIQWRPVTSYFWQPVNIQNVDSYGLEIEFAVTKKIGKHTFDFQTQYAYSISIDKELDKQLIYVPLHKVNAILNYNYKKWSINFNQQYNGEVFTTTSNTQVVDDFWLSNLYLYKTILNSKINIGISVNNLFNSKYETVAYRPMPNRNYSIQLTLKI
ncbi:MAG: TonB-dependent receptor [Flavobacteriaceae bacterium]|nr:TonB-dependent receptor [Flavobacteriaceae bacterium]